MIIAAAGDSFVYGHELKDCSVNSHDFYSKNTFTALLAKPYDYECIARGGNGNDAIARTVIEYCEANRNKPIFVLASWTFPGRYEFYFYNGTGQKTDWYSINSWVFSDLDSIENQFVNSDSRQLEILNLARKRADVYGIKNFAMNFYKHVGSGEYWEIYSSLKEIVYLQNYLKLNNIAYMFTCADNRIFYNTTVSQKDSVIASLMNQIDLDKWFFFPPGQGTNQTVTPRGFYQWAVENKYPVGVTHPLEQAHSDAADLMQEKFNELVTKSL